jgi:hypothetical protein
LNKGNLPNFDSIPAGENFGGLKILMERDFLNIFEDNKTSSGY